MTRFGLLLLITLLLPLALHAQIDDARAAIDRGEFIRAVTILSDEVAQRPSADAYLYLGIAYAHMREFEKAEDVLVEGRARFTTDPRFSNELAGVFLANNEVDRAREALGRALVVAADNAYASDLLANIDMSEGDVQSALDSWNRSGRPIIDNILNNGFRTPSHWTLNKATTFRPDSVIRYDEWRTTERRLFASGFFSNVALEVQPTPIPDHYDANLRTSLRANSLSGFFFDAFKGAPLKTSYLDIWNLGNSGVSIRSMYRWDPNRRRGELGVHAPLPLRGLLFLEATGIWRSEQWETPKGNFRFKSTGGRIMLKHIPHYRFEIGAGYEYRNRAGYDTRNFGRILAETSIRLADNRYQNRLHAEGFATHEYRAGTLELNNRLTLSKSTGTVLDWTIKGGTSRGPVPTEDLFLLGVDAKDANLLRGHSVTQNGHLGSSPMGNHFGLLNLDIERRIAVLPLFGSFNIPFLTIKGEVFADAGRIRGQGKVLVDTGAGLKFEAPTYNVNLIYGRSLRDGQQIFAAHVERRWW